MSNIKPINIAKEQGMQYEFKEFMENVYGEGAYEKHYVNGPQEEKERFERQYQALREKKIKEFMEKTYGKGSYDKHYINGPQEEKERFTIQYDALQDKAFKEFMEKTYGEGAYEKHYVKGPQEEKARFERQFFALQRKKESDRADENTQEGEATQETTDRSTETTEGNTASEDKPQTSTTVHEVDPNKTSGNENTDTEHKDEPEWKKLRRQEWEKYATQERQEFKLLSEDKAPDLNMSVGGTSINYANEHEVTMANTDEYSKFVKLIEIEKQAHTDVINFGEIKSEDYKSKLAAACLQVGLEMSNGPKYIDLSLDCFKNLDDATKQKIEAYNRKQAEREQSNQSEQGNESKPEPTAEGNGNSNGEGNESKPEPTAADTKNKTKEEYQKLYEEKLAELKAKKEKGESVDFSSIKDPVDRILTYAAAKENKLKIENLNNNELLVDKKQHGDRQGDITTALNALSEEPFKQVKSHEDRVKSLRKIKRMIKKGELNEGEYYEARRVKDADGKDKLDENGQPIYELDENGKKIYDRKKSQLNTYKDGKQTKINREDVEYTKDKDGRRQYQYTVDEQTKLRIYQEKQNGGR